MGLVEVRVQHDDTAGVGAGRQKERIGRGGGGQWGWQKPALAPFAAAVRALK